MAAMSVQPAIQPGPHLATTSSRFKVGPTGGSLTLSPISIALQLHNLSSFMEADWSPPFLSLGLGGLLKETYSRTGPSGDHE